MAVKYRDREMLAEKHQLSLSESPIGRWRAGRRIIPYALYHQMKSTQASSRGPSRYDNIYIENQTQMTKLSAASAWSAELVLCRRASAKHRH